MSIRSVQYFPLIVTMSFLRPWSHSVGAVSGSSAGKVAEAGTVAAADEPTVASQIDLAISMICSFSGWMYTMTAANATKARTYSPAMLGARKDPSQKGRTMRAQTTRNFRYMRRVSPIQTKKALAAGTVGACCGAPIVLAGPAVVPCPAVFSPLWRASAGDW